MLSWSTLEVVWRGQDWAEGENLYYDAIVSKFSLFCGSSKARTALKHSFIQPGIWGRVLHLLSLSSGYWIPAALGSLPWTVQLTSVEGKSTSWTQMRALSAITSSCWGKECFCYWGWGGPEWTYMHLLICIALQMLNNTL